MSEKPNSCCNQAENLRLHIDAEKPDLSVMKCQVCGCRHFELSVDPCDIIMHGEGIE